MNSHGFFVPSSYSVPFLSIMCVHAESLQSCPTLGEPMNCSLQPLLPMGFSRQEYRSGFPSLPPVDFPDPGIKPKSPASPALAGRFFTTGATWQAPYLSYQGYIEVETGLYGEQLLLLVTAAATH